MDRRLSATFIAWITEIRVWITLTMSSWTPDAPFIPSPLLPPPLITDTPHDLPHHFQHDMDPFTLGLKLTFPHASTASRDDSEWIPSFATAVRVQLELLGRSEARFPSSHSEFAQAPSMPPHRTAITSAVQTTNTMAHFEEFGCCRGRRQWKRHQHDFQSPQFHR